MKYYRQFFAEFSAPGKSFSAPQPDLDGADREDSTTGFQGTHIDLKGYNPQGFTPNDEYDPKGGKLKITKLLDTEMSDPSRMSANPYTWDKEEEDEVVRHHRNLPDSDIEPPTDDDEIQEFCSACLREVLLGKHPTMVGEAEYQGRKVQLGKPTRGDVKKFKVYVKDPKTGNVKKINFGDPNMKIKKSNPARRKSFRARHKCKTAKDRTTARYWSCRAW